MIPGLYKIAGELCPAVLHVTARSLAISGLYIYNDHGDIYAARMSDIPMLFSNSVQETHDLAAIAHLTTIKTGLPILHFFDGFRTSHEINTYEEIDNETIKLLVDEKGLARIRAHSTQNFQRSTAQLLAQNTFVKQSKSSVSHTRTWWNNSARSQAATTSHINTSAQQMQKTTSL